MKSVVSNFNKKAQSTEFLILLVVGAIAAVLVILALNGFFTKVEDASGGIPGSLTVAAQACKFSAQQEDKTSFCSDFKEVRIGSDQQFVNCEYLANNYEVDAETKAYATGDGNCGENAVTNFCKTLSPSDAKMKVNGGDCPASSLTCSAQGGTIKDALCGDEFTKVESSDTTNPKVCCVKN